MSQCNNEWTRRAFIKTNTLTSFSILLPGSTFDKPKKMLSIAPRYHRWHVDPGVEWLESNTEYHYLDWSIPVPNTALVLVDVWQRHYLKDTERRSEKIINQNLVPLLESCRNNGMKIIHAPSPKVARQFYTEENYTGPEKSEPDQLPWPPLDFRTKKGQYEKFARPNEPREVEKQNLPPLTIHPKVVPLKDEPIVVSGRELHDLCRKEGILFLFYVGFNTNACLITRDYGALEMSKYGYEIIIVRDCTTGMESSTTHETLAQTNNAILFFEMFGQYSIESQEVINGFTS